jgi:peptidoglycan/LPS O-acetylase OafA/YrhL
MHSAGSSVIQRPGAADAGDIGVARPNLPSLTGLRWVTALLLFGFHIMVVKYFDGTAAAAWGAVFHNGSSGVSMFFVLSGFVLTWGHAPGNSARTFFWRRLSRIYPLHLVTVMLALLVAATLVPAIRTTDPRALFANVFLVSAWWPKWWQAGNPVSWSLVCEIFFYFLFPALFRLLANRTVAVLGAVAAVALAFVAFAPTLAQLAPWTASAYSSPLLRLPEFVLGVLTALVICSGRWRGPRLCIAGPFAVCGYFAATLPVAGLTGQVDIKAFTVVSYALLIAALARRDIAGQGSFLGGRHLVRLGQISFAFYLIHLLVIASVSSPWPDGHPHLPAPAAAALTTLSFVVALALAWVLHHTVEIRVRIMLLSRRRGSQPTPIREPSR